MGFRRGRTPSGDNGKKKTCIGVEYITDKKCRRAASYQQPAPGIFTFILQCRGIDFTEISYAFFVNRGRR